MMWWAQGWGWGGWLGISLLTLVIWGAVIWFILSLTGYRSKPDAPSPRRGAEQVLADRFGAGDITIVDDQNRLSVLRGNPGGQTPRLHEIGAPR